MKQEKKKRVYLSMKLLWKIFLDYPAAKKSLDTSRENRLFLEYVESYMKSAHK